MTCSRRHSIQCVMTADSQPVNAATSAAQALQPTVRQPCHRRLSMVGELPRPGRCSSSDSTKSAGTGRRRKTATATRLHGSSIAALAAVARTPLLIGAVNHRKKSLPDNMPFHCVHPMSPSSQHYEVLHRFPNTYVLTTCWSWQMEPSTGQRRTRLTKKLQSQT